MSKITERADFDFIRYANCWEDPDILLKGLNPQPGSRILSVGSAGDNSFSLLTTNPEFVIAVDISKPQLHLIELKKVAIKNLEYDEYLKFVGFIDDIKRLQTFEKIKSFLLPDTQKYWEHHVEQIKNGIIHQGKFEKYFQMFSKKILPFIHSKKRVAKLFEKKSDQEQITFYNSKWNSWRWRLLFKIFFSKYVMGKFGRDPEFLKEVKVSVSEYIFNKAAKQLSSVEAQNNFILQYNLTGSFGSLLPHYAQKQNFEKVKSNIDKLIIKEGYAEDVFKETKNFDCMNLSNIFEYMSVELFEQTAKQLIEASKPGARLAYWNLMVPRRISINYKEMVSYEKELSEKFTDIDKGFFYNKFIIDKVLLHK